MYSPTINQMLSIDQQRLNPRKIEVMDAYKIQHQYQLKPALWQAFLDQFQAVNSPIVTTDTIVNNAYDPDLNLDPIVAMTALQQSLTHYQKTLFEISKQSVGVAQLDQAKFQAIFDHADEVKSLFYLKTDLKQNQLKPLNNLTLHRLIQQYTAQNQLVNHWNYMLEFHLTDNIAKPNLKTARENLADQTQNLCEIINADLKLKIVAIHWVLTGPKAGQIQIASLKKLSEPEKSAVIKWCAGQQSDGFGEDLNIKNEDDQYVTFKAFRKNARLKTVKIESAVV